MTGYSRGRENPLDSKNKVFLELVTNSGAVIRTCMQTLPIVTGSMRLDIAPKNMSEFKHAIRMHYKEGDIALRGASYNRKRSDQILKSGQFENSEG